LDQTIAIPAAAVHSRRKALLFVRHHYEVHGGRGRSSASFGGPDSDEAQRLPGFRRCL